MGEGSAATGGRPEVESVNEVVGRDERVVRVVVGEVVEEEVVVVALPLCV